MTIKEVKPEKSDRNEQGIIFEIVKACFEVSALGHLRAIVLYD